MKQMHFSYEQRLFSAPLSKKVMGVFLNFIFEEFNLISKIDLKCHFLQL
jgi:hypothetical protein